MGGRLHDTDLELQKTVIVALSMAAVPLGLMWALIELSVGGIRDAILSAGIAALIVANTVVFAAWRRFGWFRTTQLAIFLSFPAVLHVQLGGFTASANLIWGLATPLIALLGSRLRDGTPWFVAFIAIVSAAGFVDPLLFPANELTVMASFLEFSFNIINVSLIVYLVLLYFLKRKNHAHELLAREKETSEALLLNVLPKEVAPALKAGHVIAQRYEDASVLFADVVGFTPMSAHMSAEQMVDLLNRLFSKFDYLVAGYGIEKIRTIGDNYMVASGVPRPRTDHAQAICGLALDMIHSVESLEEPRPPRFDIRVGVNSGPMVAGVIGLHKFQYDLWGYAVNTASRMESHGSAGSVQITDATHKLIADSYECEPRGVVDIKGKGAMSTWWLRSHKAEPMGPVAPPRLR